MEENKIVENPFAKYPTDGEGLAREHNQKGYKDEDLPPFLQGLKVVSIALQLTASTKNKMCQQNIVVRQKIVARQKIREPN